jgi:hypothetical protein
MTKVAPVTSTMESSVTPHQEEDVNEFLLQKTVNNVKSRNIIWTLLSVRTLILVLAIGLTLGIVVVIVLAAASNISSLLKLKEKAEETTLDLIYTFIDTELQIPETLTEAALPVYIHDYLPNSAGTGMLMLY